jgi:murein DD-endopeptidase MepM/ murein hydrolase activator NlpD
MRRGFAMLFVSTLLGAVLSACAAERPIYPVGHVMPMEPPPAPRRKPAPPSGFLARAAQPQIVESGQASASQPAIQSEPLAPPPRQDTASQPAVAATSVAPPVAGRPADGRYKVQLGDTLYGISRSFGLPIRALIDANALRPPYALSAGRELIIPNPDLHRVASGETVYGISRAYGVEMSELVRLNAIEPPYTIAVGTTVILPGSSIPQNASAALAPPAPAPAPAPAPVTAQQATADPGPATGLESDATTSPSPSATAAPTEAFGVPRPRRKPARGTAPPASQASPAAPQVATRTAPQAANLPIPKPPARTGGKFLWPVPGKVVGKFGPQGSGRHNDGINILAPRGTPVRAAENGVVVYAGEQLKGFGRMLLVKHSDSWITAYAHNDTLLVERGQTVQRGQPIARVGSSGNVASPQLHFEVRKGKRAVDPVRVLGKNPVQSSG